MVNSEADDPGILIERIARLEARVQALERALALFMHSAPDDLDRTQPMHLLDARGARPAGAPHPVPDSLGITASFAALDSVVAEAAQDELRLLKGRAFKSPIEIDESLIDKAFARPPPEKIDVNSFLEEFHPKIAQRVVLTWRTPELLQYLQRLIVDERGDRAGFSPGVMSELLLLSGILEAPCAMVK